MNNPRLRGYYTGIRLEPGVWRMHRARPLPAWPWVVLVIVSAVSLVLGVWA